MRRRLDRVFYEFVESYPSINTRDAYIRDLQDFVEFSQKDNPADWKVDDVVSFRESLSSVRTPSTVHRKMSVIRTFSDWCVKCGTLSSSPASNVKIPKSRSSKPTLAFTDEEVKKLMSIPSQESFHGRVHKLALSLLFRLGLRRSELVKIQLRDIYEDRGHMVLSIHGKGDKRRELPLSTQAVEDVQSFLKWYEFKTGQKLDSEDFLLQSSLSEKNSSPMDPGVIYRMVRRYAKACGIARRVGAHSCRATAISHLLDTQKVPIRDVADFAGHSNVGTTMLYDKKRRGLDDSAAYKIGF